MPDLAAGTVTFLFTDIEGSTQLLRELGDLYAAALADHHAILRGVCGKWNGNEIDTQGDSFFVAFARAGDAIATAVEAQRALAAHSWPNDATLRVRMGLHTGEPAIGPTGYVGIDVHRAARICSAGHGGQVLVSDATRVLAENELPSGIAFKDLGEHRLKDLQRPERLFQLIIPELALEFPPLKSLDAVPNNLPIQLTSFVGRADTLSEVKQLLSTTRLLTLTGTGGTGKTRLSLQLAADELDAFPDGVWLIELGQLSDPNLIPQSIASTLEVREVAGRPLMVALVDYMRDKNLLLTLDNCEHMIDACAKLADSLLHACPRLKILTSSREALGIAGETSFRVPSLALPPEQATVLDLDCESACLFVERANAVQPRFAVTSQNAPAIAQICRRLDGIPLALELAAARVNVFTVEQIAARLNDRFRLLTGGSRTAMPRQQTLRAAIDWSYDLLSEAERVLLRRLSVFVGGWTFEAAERVAADDRQLATKEGISPTIPYLPAEDLLDLLSHLVSKSLVVVDEQEQAARYRMLETVRQYARDKLLDSGEAPQLHDRHLEFFADFAQRADHELNGQDVLQWLTRCEVEHDNLRAALAWALETRPDVALALAVNLEGFLDMRGLAAESQNWLGEALARVQALPPVQGQAARRRALAIAKGQLRWGHSAIVKGEQHALARARLKEGMALAQKIGDEALIADALSLNALGAMLVGDAEAAGPLAEESVAHYRKIDDPAGLARALMILGQYSARLGGNYTRASACLEESIRISRQSGVARALGMAQMGFAFIALSQRDYAAARALFEKGLESFSRLGDKHFANTMKSGLADVARREGNYTEAAALYHECLAVWREFGHRGAIARCLECLGFIANAQGEPERAAQLMGAAQTLREISDSQMTPEEGPEYDHELAILHSKLDAATFAKEWKQGRGLTIEQAIALSPGVAAAGIENQPASAKL